MGIDYAFRLFFEDDQARDVLGAVANLAFETSGEFSTVSFADGESVNVPFTVKFKNSLVSLAEPEAVVSLDTSLWFATDDLIDDFVVECR